MPKEDGFITGIYAPARRALSHAGITTLEQLSAFSEKRLLELHGMGKATIPVLRKALREVGLDLARD